MSNDAAEQPQPAEREEQHGPEMDDDQVEATNAFVDSLPPAGNDRGNDDLEDLED